MNSLRTRLILGSSLVALVPLALAMYLLSRQIEDTVRAEARERLAAVLGVLQVQLRADGEDIAEKLRILGRDPALKRLYLLRTGALRDLADYLAEKRFLLGLDFLQVADTSGTMIADGWLAGPAPGRSEREPVRIELAGRGLSDGLGVVTLNAGQAMVMMARAPIRYENEAAGLVRGGLLLDAGFLARLGKTGGVELLLRDASGVTVASTLGGAAPTLALATGAEARRVEIGGRWYFCRVASLGDSAAPAPSIAGLVSTAAADQTIQGLQATSAFLGLIGLGIAVLLGVLWSRQISRPVERIAEYSGRIAAGEWNDPLVLRSVRELQTLVGALNRMRESLRASRDRLVVSERQAAWGQMARAVAHEIKNPLTPIAISISDLRRSFEQQRADFPAILDQAVRTIAEEVENLKHMLQEFSDYGRLPAPAFAPCRASELFSDLETLYGREVAEGRLRFERPGAEIAFRADPGQVRQALVNLVKNGLEALAGEGRVTVAARAGGGALELSVSDTGPGLSAERKAQLFVPGLTTKEHGSGLGLTIVERIVSDHRGTIAVQSEPGRGTTFRLRLPLDPEA